MTEIPIDNVVPIRSKDPTAALRARRARRKRKTVTVPIVTDSVTAQDNPKVTLTVTPPLISLEDSSDTKTVDRHGDRHIGTLSKGDLGRSMAVRDAAQRAAAPILAVSSDDYIGRLLALDADDEGLSTVPSWGGLAPDQRRHFTAELERGGGAVSICALTAALSLAAVSGYFSVTGLSTIFTGAPVSVTCLGAAFEVGKLAGVAWLGRFGSTAPLALRVALTVLILGMMGLDAVSAFGFLSRAQIEHSVMGDAAAEARVAQLHEKAAVQTEVVADLDRRIAQIDGAVDAATRRGRTRGAMVLVDQQKANRADLVRQRSTAAGELADLRAQEVGVQSVRRGVDAADLGPVKYLAGLVGMPVDSALRYFILIVAMLLDPTAVALLYAATHGRNGRR
jgi:hypothetical protein